MSWTVIFHEEFETEFDDLPEEVQNKLLTHAELLEEFGVTLARPYADTLNGSKYRNMKELRFNANDGVWRVAFAFDPKRQAILLVAGDKSGVSKQRFYHRLINLADKRFDNYLANIEK